MLTKINRFGSFSEGDIAINIKFTLKLLFWHIETCFYHCRNFRHLIKATSSVLMTYWSDDVIVDFVITHISVNHCLGLAYDVIRPVRQYY